MAVTGPTPGVVINRRAAASSLDRRLISTSKTAMFASSDFKISDQNLQHRSCAFRQLTVWVFDLVDQRCDVCWSFGDDVAVLCQMPP